MFKKSLLAVSVAALAAVAPLANAYETGDFVIRAGIVTVQPHEDSGHIAAGPLGKVGGSKATVDHDEELGLTFSYFFTDHLAVELLGATPFKHKVGYKGLGGAGLPNSKLADIKELPPTLSLVYYPLQKDYPVQPYVGLGINYTHFFDEDLSSDAKSKGFHGLDLDDSWGAAAEVGADWRLTDRLFINTQVRYIDIDTTAKAHLDGVGRVKVDVDVDPWVYMVALGYKF